MAWYNSASLMKENQSIQNTAQCPAKWSCQKQNQNYVFALRKTLEQAVVPPTDLTDNLGVVQGLDEEEVRCASDRDPHTDEWKKIIASTH